MHALVVVVALGTVLLGGCKSDIGGTGDADVPGDADASDLTGDTITSHSDVVGDGASGDPDTSDGAPGDASSHDSSVSDVSANETNTVCPGGAGCPCTDNTECDTAACIETHEGKRCALPCAEDCPSGFTCQKLAGADGSFYCVSKTVTACAPCQKDADCQPNGQPALCLDYGGEGRFCGASCDDAGDCPADYTCEDSKGVGGTTAKQCRRKQGACPCSSWAVAHAAKTSCAATNVHGTCTGTRSCTATGLSPCDAAVAAPEVCNNVDDDCNGTKDDLPKDATCSVKAFKPSGSGAACKTDADCKNAAEACQSGKCQELIGACIGTPSCSSGGELVCLGAKTPTPEACNLTDDDCDGQTDEDPCDDGDACTSADACSLGACVGSKSTSCDDGNTCTTDACDPKAGCSHKPAALSCDDGDACTEGDLCGASAACLPGKASKDCDDANPCTSDSCDPKKGCVYLPNQATVSCFDGPLATKGVGACGAGSATCASGKLGSCQGATLPAVSEACDGVDDDCDGVTDEGCKPSSADLRVGWMSARGGAKGSPQIQLRGELGPVGRVAGKTKTMILGALARLFGGAP